MTTPTDTLLSERCPRSPTGGRHVWTIVYLHDELRQECAWCLLVWPNEEA